MKAVILDQATFGEDVSWQNLLSLPLDWQCYASTSKEQTPARIADAEVVLSNKVVLDAACIAGATRLKYIGVLATGTNNIDKSAAAAAGITVNNVEGYGTASVVQHTLMLMLNLAGNFVPYQKQIAAGDWQRAKMFCLMDHPISELAGKHLVIVGQGELGRSLAAVATALGMHVTFSARPGNESSDSRPALETLLPEADVVSLHCLLSPETDNLINASRLARFKPGSWLINTARGGLIDEQALCDALASGPIGGAAVDVLREEPPVKGSPLLDYRGDNLIITPHNAWASQQARQRLLDMAADKLQQYLL